MQPNEILPRFTYRSGPGPPKRGSGGRVFWWFERQGVYTRYEVVESPEGGWELRLVNADGQEHVERFQYADDLAKRQRELEAELKAQGWTGPHGWVL